MSLPINNLYRFDDFVLDPSKRTFARRGEALSVSPKAFEVLTYLVRNPGRVVTKDELLKAVWPDSFVEEGNLAQHISWLRKALGDRSNDIVTVPGRGYQFTAPVRTEPMADLFPEKQPGDTLIQRVRERTHMVIEESSVAPLAEQTARASMRPWTYAVVAAGALALAIGAGWKWLRPAPPAEFQKIVVADFINATGDPAFDRTLKRALEIDLEQSPFLDVMNEGEAVSTLQLMGRKGDVAVTANVAMELCVRSNRQVFLTGSITSVGREYLLMLGATDCNSGRELVSAKTQAGAKEKVLGALDVVADRIRKGLGESAKSLERFQVPISKATTPSLEALKAYSFGKYLDAQGKEAIEILSFYQKAVELDPQFAMAYDALANTYINLNEYDLAWQYYQKAFACSGGVSEKEKLIIQMQHERNPEQRIKTCELWATTYPHDAIPLQGIANDWTDLGQYAAAIQAGQRALERDPDRGLIYYVLIRAYRGAHRFAEAKAAGREAVRRGKDPTRLHALLFTIAVAERDQSTLARETRWSEDHANDYFFMALRAEAAATLGKYREAEKLFQRAYEAAAQANLPEAADDILLDQAMIEFYLGRPAASRATLSRMTKPEPDSSDLAILRAQWGDLSSAEHFLADHSNETRDSVVIYVEVPLVRAALAVERQKPLEAIATLEAATPYELAYYSVPSARGEACLRAHRPEMAAIEYQKILANQGIDPTSPLYPLAYLGLARAYALENHKTESREEYEKLFAFWKDADADLPVLKQARLDYARLR
jgi:DNA-binding winged helix-turn-helix (wHTH) protein/tetratricopeptide (TPR) repeat protein